MTVTPVVLDLQGTVRFLEAITRKLLISDREVRGASQQILKAQNDFISMQARSVGPSLSLL